MLKLLLLDC